MNSPSWLRRLYEKSLEEESGAALAWIRILVGASVVYEFLPFVFSESGRSVLRLAFGGESFGGYRSVGPFGGFALPGVDHGLFNQSVAILALGAAVTLTAGLHTRLSAVALAFFTYVLHSQNNEASGGSDQLLGNLLFLLALSGAGETLSVDARRRLGKWFSDALVPAWPRRMILLQAIVVYTTTGIQKLVSTAWTPVDGFSALYLILQSPHWTRFPSLIEEYGSVLRIPLALGSFATIAWELTFPLVLLRKLRPAYALLGLVFHLGIELTMDVGLFGFLSLAMYPALFPELCARLSAETGPLAALRIPPPRSPGPDPN